MGPIRETGVPVEADLIQRGFPKRVLTTYIAHYHVERNHQGKHNLLLFPTPADTSPPGQRILCNHRLGGLLKYYTRVA